MLAALVNALNSTQFTDRKSIHFLLFCATVFAWTFEADRFLVSQAQRRKPECLAKMHPTRKETRRDGLCQAPPRGSRPRGITYTVRIWTTPCVKFSKDGFVVSGAYQSVGQSGCWRHVENKAESNEQRDIIKPDAPVILSWLVLGEQTPDNSR